MAKSKRQLKSTTLLKRIKNKAKGSSVKEALEQVMEGKDEETRRLAQTILHQSLIGFGVDWALDAEETFPSPR